MAYGILYLGNNKSSDTDGNSQGILRIYGSGTAYSNIYSSATSKRNQVLPDKDGTFAMTSDLSSYLPLSGGVLTNDLAINNKNGTTSSLGTSQLWLGNSMSSGKTGNSRGQLILYGTGAYYGNLRVGANTAHRTYTLPNADGTIALTSNIPTLSIVMFRNASAFTIGANSTAEVTFTGTLPSGATKLGAVGLNPGSIGVVFVTSEVTTSSGGQYVAVMRNVTSSSITVTAKNASISVLCKQ